MAEPQMLITLTGVRHKAARLVDERGDGWRQWWLEAACDPWTVGEPYTAGPCTDCCPRCFPSPDASLGAASTTLNPPPGEHTGDQQ